MDVVPDVVFLILFAVLGFYLLGRGIERREQIAAAWPPEGHRSIVDATRLTGEEVGCLAGSKPRALQAVVARLRVAGVVTYDRDAGTLVPTGDDLPDGSPPLAAAVLAAATARTPAGKLASEWRVARELDRISWSVRVAVAHHDVPRRHFLSAGLPVVVLGVTGLVWAAVPPLRWFTDLPLIVLALIAVGSGWLLCGRPDGIETVAVRELRRVREANAHLDPGMRPALSTYGPAAAALAVGLFGPSVLASTDPDVAALSFVPVASPTGEESRAAASASGGDVAGGVADTAGGVVEVSSCGGGCGGGGCGG